MTSYVATVLERTDFQSLDFQALECLGKAIEEAVPIPPRHRRELKGDIRSLWESLTSQRQSRQADYLGNPGALSAYIRYFMPWNVVRLLSIFTRGEFPLSSQATIVDIGSGPLTVPIALYLAYPELRSQRLNFYCYDRTERIMRAGLSTFETLCAKSEGRLPDWQFTIKKGDFGDLPLEKANMITAANVFNEFFWKGKDNLGEKAESLARTLRGSLRDDGVVLIMEPGDPRSGSFISAIRASFLELGMTPIAPCTHGKACSMPGFFRSRTESGRGPAPSNTRRDTPSGPKRPGYDSYASTVLPKQRDKYPWCHFTVAADTAPQWLKNISDTAGLPKDKLSYSYLIVKATRQYAAYGPSADEGARTPVRNRDPHKLPAPGKLLVRVVSEEFPLSGAPTEKPIQGRYSCSQIGYTLVKKVRGTAHFSSGDLVLFEKVEGARQLPGPPLASQGGPGRKARGAPSSPSPLSKAGAKSQASDELQLDEKSGACIVSY